MALAIPGFNAEEFREGIRIPMRMGLPVDPAQWPEFVTIIDPQLDPELVDENGTPWNPDLPLPDPVTTRVRVLCAYEMNPEPNEDRPWGQLQPGAVEITLLDEEYSQVRGFDYVNLWPAGAGTDPVPYRYERVLGQYNLDTVGVWTLECRTEDEV